MKIKREEIKRMLATAYDEGYNQSFESATNALSEAEMLMRREMAEDTQKDCALAYATELMEEYGY